MSKELELIAEGVAKARNQLELRKGSMGEGWYSKAYVSDEEIAEHVLSRLSEHGYSIVEREELFADQADEIAVLKQDLADTQAMVAAVRALVRSEPGEPGYKWDCVHAFEITNAAAAAAAAAAEEDQ